MAVETRADIAGVHREWEDVAAVRQHFRGYGSIFRDVNPADTPHVNVKSAILNVEALLPLARRLGVDGEVRMVSIPDLVRELLGLVRTKYLVNFPSPTPSNPQHFKCFKKGHTMFYRFVAGKVFFKQGASMY